MSQLHGKQLRNESIVLDKLSGLGSATFSSGASMIFQSGTTLRRDTNGISENTDVVNKEYVDSIASGLDVKEAARLLSDGDISGTYDNGSSGVGATITLSAGTLTIDGVAVTDGDRVVLKGQTDAEENGIYDVSGVSSTVVLTRSEDFDGSPAKEINGGEFVFIKEGDDYADTGFVVSTPNDEITIGTHDINFTQFSAAGVISAGLGLVQNGNTFDVITGTGLTASANEVKLADTAVSAGSYGSATAVSTFTVDDQGRLTAAGTTNIAITSTQVTDFATEVNSEVFDSSNFIDSSTIDFDVTSGTTVSADIKRDGTKGIDVNATGVFVKVDNSTIQFDGSGQLEVNPSALAVQGADNGLSLSGTDIILGGTLSQDTIISGNGLRSLLIKDITELGFDAGGIEINSDNNFNVTAASNNFSAGTTTYTDTDSETGIRYAAAGYVTHDRSLTDKEYVDDAITAAQTSTTYYATDGITLSGQTFSLATTAAGDGLSYTSGVLEVEVDGTTIDIVNGVLTAVGGSAVPVYEIYDASTTFINPVGAGIGGVFAEISAIPNNFSRLQVFINGLQVSVGDNDQKAGLPKWGTLSQPVQLHGTELKWWGPYDLDTIDYVEIVYEK